MSQRSSAPELPADGPAEAPASSPEPVDEGRVPVPPAVPGPAAEAASADSRATLEALNRLHASLGRTQRTLEALMAEILLAELQQPARPADAAALPGVAIGRGPAPAPTPLDDRPSAAELRVLELLPTELTRREIAAALHISVNTAKTHLRRLYRRLGVTDREHAVVIARRRGYLDGP